MYDPRKEFTLEDFMSQMAKVRDLGSMSRIMDMIPGMKELKPQVREDEIERQMDRMQAIYRSMTADERRVPQTLDNNHRRRIARGSGAEVAEVDQFIKQFEMSKAMMDRVRGMGRRRL